jgi:hypothetical protein
MQGSDDFTSRPPRWNRIAPKRPADGRKDMAGVIGPEMRHVFSPVQTLSDFEGARRLLEEIELKRRRAR